MLPYNEKSQTKGGKAMGLETQKQKKSHHPGRYQGINQRPTRKAQLTAATQLS
jgi:hypothetical protein